MRLGTTGLGRFILGRRGRDRATVITGPIRGTTRTVVAITGSKVAI